MRNVDIARVCHEANRAYCKSLGDHSQLPWAESPEWQRASAMDGVENIIQNGAEPAASHESWMAEKARTGWIYGAVKDAEAKTHPCFMPWAELPEDQQRKDLLFCAVVIALLPENKESPQKSPGDAPGPDGDIGTSESPDAAVSEGSAGVTSGPE